MTMRVTQIIFLPEHHATLRPRDLITRRVLTLALEVCRLICTRKFNEQVSGGMKINECDEEMHICILLEHSSD